VAKIKKKRKKHFYIRGSIFSCILASGIKEQTDKQIRSIWQILCLQTPLKRPHSQLTRNMKRFFCDSWASRLLRCDRLGLIFRHIAHTQ